MTISHSYEFLKTAAQKIFEAAGVPATEAEIVARMLVDSDLIGLSSHGVQRIQQYVNDIRQGAIKPGKQVQVKRKSPTIAMVDGQWNFGQVVAKRATEEAITMAQTQGLGSVVIRGCRHVGRLGAYTELCAAANCIGLAMASCGNEGHWVAPFGGREGRIGTNPISFAAPTAATPIVMDFSTSVAAEGKVRLLRDSGEKLPEAMLVNDRGELSDDPWDLYKGKTNERSGAILPFGGSQGYKGFGLGLMVQILAASFGGPVWASEGVDRFTNGVWLLAIDINSAMNAEQFREDVRAMTDYIKSASPDEKGNQPMVPGEMEQRTAEHRRAFGIPLNDNIWRGIVETGESLGVDVLALTES